MSAPAYAYQAPHHPAAYPDQCYYRTGERGISVHIADRGPETADLCIFRFASEHRGRCVELQMKLPECGLTVKLDAATVRALHAALGDVLVDIDAASGETERAESFARIQEEMRDAEEQGGTGCYYAHPDVHYVPADQVAAKVAELNAAGVARFMVLADPAFGEVAA